MLTVLHVKNLAIVEDLEIELEQGLNVLTGETGAGKSIILKAISLLGGARASGDIIRNGQSRCEVEGFFYINRDVCDAVLNSVDEAAEFLKTDEILIRRVIEEGGKGKIYINSQLVTATVLQKIAPFLFDITGQHQQQSLLDTDHHRSLLDEFGVPENLLQSVREAFQNYSIAKKLLNDFQKENSEKAEYFRRISFEREELKKTQLKVGEREELEAEVSRLQNVEVLGTSVNDCLGLLEGDSEGCEAHVGKIRGILEGALRKDANLTEAYQLIDSAYQQIKEARYSMSEYLASLEADPERLEMIRERITEIARLERKYRKKVEDIIGYLQQIEQELSQYESGEFDAEKLQKRFDEAEENLRAIEDKLSKARRVVADKLEKMVEVELVKLNMKKARFNISIADTASSQYGKDLVEFMLAANPGEPYRPLVKVASGGELSRVLLVLKTLLNEKLAPGLQVFDEVDTGIGGAVAEIVGEKLKEVSQRSQVLLVTHAPQIAALADTHLMVSKISSDKATKVTIKRLSTDARVEAIASMLAGKNVTDKFFDSARELLKHHQKKK